MTGLRARVVHASRDEGSALVLALIVVALVGVIVTAVLSFAGNSLLNTPKLRDQRNQTDYASGALQGAINNIRNSSVLGSTFGGCPTYAPGNTASNPGADGHSFTVSCQAQSPIGGSSTTDQPNWAIQTLGTASGDGINDSSGNGLLTIDGGIYSNGQITVGGGAHNAIQVVGSAFAEKSCAPISDITTTDLVGPQCNYSDTRHLGDDPNYTSGVADAAALTYLINNSGADPMPTCPNSGVVRFSPGYYSETPDTLVSNLAPSCGGSVWWFQPGVYYFNYVGSWAVGTAIGGTPHGSWSTGGSSPALDGSDCDDTQDGVQFIFGGASRLTVGHKDALELCAPINSQTISGLPQHIALFGLKSGSAPSATTGTFLANQAPTSSGAHPFAPVANAQTIDNQSATATIGAGQTATLTYPSFADVPKGARVTSASLQIKATVPNKTTAQALIKVSSKPAGQAFAVPASCSSTCSIDISSALKVPYWRDLNSLTVDYTATGGSLGSGTASPTVDGVQLSITYTVPALQALQCTTGCTFFDAGAPDVTVYMHGTVYTPTAGWDLEFQNKSDALFDRGVIFRTVTLNNNPSFKQTDSPFQLPAASPLNREVRFTAYMDSVPKLRACVLYTDHTTLPDGTPGPAFPGYRVTVQHWSVLRSDDGQGSPSCG